MFEVERHSDGVMYDVYDGSVFRDLQEHEKYKNDIDDDSKLNFFLMSGVDWGDIYNFSQAGHLGFYMVVPLNVPRITRFAGLNM